MKRLDSKINKIFLKVEFLAPWLIRFGLGIAFALHGLGKFPLPPQGLSNFLGSSLASLVAISELGAGLILIIGGFISFKRHTLDWLGDLVTRFSGFTIGCITTGVIWISKPESFIDVILYDNLHIFLWVGGLYFALRGSRK